VTPAIVWFRQDLRLRDNPALCAAVRRGGGVVPVFILDKAGEGRWAPGAASRWWLHHSLVSLDASLRARGLRLVVARGGSLETLRRIANRTGARAAYWNRRHEPAVVARDRAVEDALARDGMDARGFNGSLLFEPGSVANRKGEPFRVFTPFWRRCLELPVAPPLRLGAGRLRAPAAWPRSLAIGDLGLLSRKGRQPHLADHWQPGERGAALRLRRFVSRAIGSYGGDRDRPGLEGTSGLSPWLHFGELSPRQVWSAVRGLSGGSGVFPPSKGAAVFLREIGWREFAHHLLVHYPGTPESPLRPAFLRFPWSDDPGGAMLRAWRAGRTGYPIVDAGMRQLLQTGWMHNRVRMIAASFLVKHLRISWVHGADWFWNALVDADLANNTLGWQWTAGCGADAAPFFRIFAPVGQGVRWDPEGDYVRRWVPELKGLPAAYIHSPWSAPSSALRAAGVSLGRSYPLPIVDHAAARAAALDAFRSLRADRRA
jgi:deoxyribodipyrimidine photo-lyase